MIMRKLILVMLVCGFALIALAKEPETIEQLKARAEAAEKKKQPELYAKLAKMQAEAANDAYNTNVEQARTLIDDAAKSAEKASQASIETGKRLKKTEIDLRQLGNRMEDIARSWAFDDRAPAKSAIQRVETARSKLLDRMFSK